MNQYKGIGDVRFVISKPIDKEWKLVAGWEITMDDGVQLSIKRIQSIDNDGSRVRIIGVGTPTKPRPATD